MQTQLANVIDELRLQLELDEERGSAPLAVRARALSAANAAGDRAAERQALIDLAAACVARAARLPAPRLALTELQTRGVHNLRSLRPPRRSRRAAAKTA